MEVVVLFSIITFSFGYIIGRIGHIMGGHLKTLHHWIYGLFLVVVGGIFWREFWGLLVLFFGIGLFISDFKDFLDLKFYGVDENVLKRFWDVD
ncbi:hypothetical protein KKC49_04015 [Patescibacteria group bacterium]|nr:hypothetical protein [Patescibacteria group bacterium]